MKQRRCNTCIAGTDRALHHAGLIFPNIRRIPDTRQYPYSMQN